MVYFKTSASGVEVNVDGSLGKRIFDAVNLEPGKPLGCRCRACAANPTFLLLVAIAKRLTKHETPSRRPTEVKGSGTPYNPRWVALLIKVKVTSVTKPMRL